MKRLVVTYKLRWLQDKIAILNRKATKLKVEPIQIKVGQTWEKKKTFIWENEEQYFTTDMTEVEVLGIAPKINGWTFAGTIEHQGGVNIIRKVVDEEVPETYRSAAKTCEHCNKIRSRNETYIVLNESGEFKRVGKSCLKDYTGHTNPQWLAELASLDYIFEEDSQPDEYSTRGLNYQESLPAEAFLATACESVVQKKTFAPKSAKLGFSTAGAAWEYHWPRRKDAKESWYDYQRYIDSIALPETPEGKELFEKVRAYMVAFIADDCWKNDFQHNVCTTYQMKEILPKHAGILACAILLYQKELIKPRKRAEPKPDSQHVGEIKKREIFELTLKKHVVCDSEYGYEPSTFSILIFEDAKGNVLVWKTGKDAPCYEGETVKLKGTVIQHSEYKGVKQTRINRCVLIEDPASQVKKPEEVSNQHVS